MPGMNLAELPLSDYPAIHRIAQLDANPDDPAAVTHLTWPARVDGIGRMGLLPGLDGMRSGNVSMLVMIIVGQSERFGVSPGNGSLVPRVVFGV